MTESEVLIIGGGIAGISLAAMLAGRARVTLLEREDHLAYHTTGRSAALFSEIYGNEDVREWSRAGRAFFENPPEGFASVPLVSPRPLLFGARLKDITAFEAFCADDPEKTRVVSATEAVARVPVLRAEQFHSYCEEAGSLDIDVSALFEGFRRMAKARGVNILTGSEVFGLDRDRASWRVRTRRGEYAAAVVVNAAGAWAGKIGELAGLGNRGLVPMRRTAVLIDPPEGVDAARWPFFYDIGDDFYFKPESGLILASPVDETPSEPCDAQPDEIDIATIAARIEEFTTLTVRRIRRSWAGLRTFTPDRTPLFEFDERKDGFFWLAGQGGYGIQTAPEISRRAAELICSSL